MTPAIIILAVYATGLLILIFNNINLTRIIRKSRIRIRAFRRYR